MSDFETGIASFAERPAADKLVWELSTEGLTRSPTELSNKSDRDIGGQEEAV